MITNENKSRQAWLRAWDHNTLQQGESQTGAFYNAKAIDDFRQMSEEEKAKLPAQVRQEYEETIDNLDFYEQEQKQKTIWIFTSKSKDKWVELT